jgi:hypothetical protein
MLVLLIKANKKDPMVNETEPFKVLSDDADELVIKTPDGKAQKYKRDPIRSMIFQVKTLGVGAQATSFSMRSGAEIASLPGLKPYLRGTAFLDDRSISVMGHPNTETNHVDIQFRVYTDEDRADIDERALKDGKVPRYTGASLGFLDGDWEIGSEASWYVSCYVLPENYAELCAAVTAGTLRRLTVGLDLRGIFTDHDWMPPSMKADWFLPLKKIGSRYRSDTAWGDIENLALELSSVTLHTKLEEDEPPDPTRQEPEPRYPVPEKEKAAPDPTAIALNGLARNIETLHGTLKRLGWLVVGTLLIVAFKFK